MSKKQFIFSSVYAVASICFGLLLHPYQTMQSLVKQRMFVWLTLMPLGVLALVTILWRMGVVPVVQVIFSCAAVTVPICDSLTFFSNVITFFCLYWQILLGYLLLRFRLAVYFSEHDGVSV